LVEARQQPILKQHVEPGCSIVHWDCVHWLLTEQITVKIKRLTIERKNISFIFERYLKKDTHLYRTGYESTWKIILEWVNAWYS
jgi:hypothetical protein